MSAAPSSPNHTSSSPEPTTNTRKRRVEDYESDEEPQPKAKRKRLKYTAEQVAMLEKIYEKDPLPNLSKREELSKILHRSARSVQIWFQNKRAKDKKNPKPQIPDDEEEDTLDTSLPTSKPLHTPLPNLSTLIPELKPHMQGSSTPYIPPSILQPPVPPRQHHVQPLPSYSTLPAFNVKATPYPAYQVAAGSWCYTNPFVLHVDSSCITIELGTKRIVYDMNTLTSIVWDPHVDAYYAMFTLYLSLAPRFFIRDESTWIACADFTNGEASKLVHYLYLDKRTATVFSETLANKNPKVKIRCATKMPIAQTGFIATHQVTQACMEKAVKVVNNVDVNVQ